MDCGFMERDEEMVEVSPTETGLGVFAKRYFLPNEIVGGMDGIVIDDPEHGSDYCVALTGTRALEPDAPFCYLNHSCQPNCELLRSESVESCDPVEEFGEEQPEIWVEAIREIAPGEQLTIDYAWPADAAIPCLCESSQCRGWIVAEEEMGDLLARAEDTVGQGLP